MTRGLCVNRVVGLVDRMREGCWNC